MPLAPGLWDMSSDRPHVHVLYVIDGLGTGGAERSLAELIRPLGELGIHLTVATFHSRTEGVESEVADLVDVRSVGPGPARGLMRLRNLIREAEPDVIHTTLFESDVTGRIASVGSGARVVSSIVNASYSGSAATKPGVSPTKLAAARMIDGWTARRFVDRFHALTETAKRSAVEALGIDPESIDVIGRGRDPERLGRFSEHRRRSIRSSLGIGDDTPLLLSVGRREYQKGQIHAIEAMAHIGARHPGAMLLIAGRRGPMSSRLESTTRDLGLTQSVRFLGHRPDVPDLMVAADVLVFPSLYEGFGGTLIEAMALDLPIVTSDLEVLREVAGDAALYAPTADARALAERARLPLESEDVVRDLRERGRKRFEDRYTIDRVSQQMCEMYRTMTGV